MSQTPQIVRGPPEALVESVAATNGGAKAFGRRLVAAAYERGFHAAVVGSTPAPEVGALTSVTAVLAPLQNRVA